MIVKFFPETCFNIMWQIKFKPSLFSLPQYKKLLLQEVTFERGLCPIFVPIITFILCLYVPVFQIKYSIKKRKEDNFLISFYSSDYFLS